MARKDASILFSVDYIVGIPMLAPPAPANRRAVPVRDRYTGTDTGTGTGTGTGGPVPVPVPVSSEGHRSNIRYSELNCRSDGGLEDS